MHGLKKYFVGHFENFSFVQLFFFDTNVFFSEI